MKKIIISIIFLISIGFYSCEDMLTVKPESLLTSGTMWEDRGDIEAALAGTYSRFRTTFNSYDFLYWYEMRAMNIAGGIQPYGSVIEYNDNTLLNTTEGTNWENIYQVISSANGIIDNIDKVIFDNEGDKNMVNAQAIFIRAWCYFTLVRVWGDVPIIDHQINSTNDEQLYPSRSPVSDVFEFIKEDLSKALSLYVDTNPTEPGKISRAAILMLKTDVYLWIAKRLNGGDNALNDAETSVNEVLSFSSYGLLENYGGIFTTEENKELIFTIYFDEIEGGVQYGKLFSQAKTFVPAEYWENPIPVANTEHRLMLSDHYWNSYHKKDTIDSRASVNGDELIIEDVNFRWSNKYAGNINSGERYFYTDTRIYRFAEAILFKAEILAAKNNISEAVSYLNNIAERAYGASNYYNTSMSKEELENKILDERMIEFATEGKAWFDILRFGKAFERIPSLAGRENDYQGNILLLPINVATITLNKNITQTPGYE